MRISGRAKHIASVAFGESAAAQEFVTMIHGLAERIEKLEAEVFPPAPAALVALVAPAAPSPAPVASAEPPPAASVEQTTAPTAPAPSAPAA